MVDETITDATRGKSARRDLTQGSVLSNLLKLGLPMTVGLSTMILYHLVDTYFISRLGLKPLAGITFTFPVTMFLGSISIGLGIGVSSVVSRFLGAGRTEEAARITTHALMFSFVVMVILCVAGKFTIEPLFNALGATDDIMAYIKDYMGIWYFGMMFMVIPMVGNNAIRASGQAMFPAIVMMVSACVNAVLAPIMIFGLLGFPRMEMQGAALSTIIAHYSASCCSLYFLRYRVHLIGWTKIHLVKFMDDLKRILHVGIPSALMQLVRPISMSVITWMIAEFGKDTVAGFGVATRVEMVMSIPMIAMGSSLTPFVGQNWGAGRTDRIYQAVHKAALICFCWSILSVAILVGLGHPIAELFSDEGAVADVAYHYFMIVVLVGFFPAVTHILASTFNGLARPRSSLFAMAGQQIIIYVPLALVLKQEFGVYGIFTAAAIANVCVAVIYYIWARRRLRGL